MAGFGLGIPVVVATDDSRVAAAVSDLAGLGVRAALTSPALRSGTERAAAVLALPEYGDFDVVLNVQGDEPLIPEAAITGALGRVTAVGEPIGTAAARLEEGALADPHCVKVAVDRSGLARGFFRAVPEREWPPAWSWWRHLGVYAYQAGALKQWVALPPVPEERERGLEQLRPLAYGMRIGVAVLDVLAPPAVDTENDVQRIENRWALAT